MDKLMFKKHLKGCTPLKEETSCVEVFNYTDVAQNYRGEHDLAEDEVLQFVNRKGRFTPATPDNGPEPLSSLRLVLQKETKEYNSFAPGRISFPRETYEVIMEKFKLPLQAVELTSMVGSLFWHRYVELEGDDPYLQIIYSRHHVHSELSSRGWQVILSYSIRRRETLGFVRGTKSFNVPECVRDLLSMASEIGHPMLLPGIALSNHMADGPERKLRSSRSRIRDAERRIKTEIQNILKTDNSQRHGLNVDLDGLASDLTNLNNELLWDPPFELSKVATGMQEAMDCFREKVLRDLNGADLRGFHEELEGRLRCQKYRIDLLENYKSVSADRLEVQRGMISLIVAQLALHDSRVNLRLADDQRDIARAGKALSLFGAVFLPGTFIAAIFSMTFFDFQSDSPLSSKIWIYFAITIPVTIFVVVAWVLWKPPQASERPKDSGDPQARESV